jgi:hypothetical protein
MEPMSVHVTEMLQRLSNRACTFSIELSQLRDHVDNCFTHVEGHWVSGFLEGPLSKLWYS